MTILVVDGLGGGLGAQIVTQLRQQLPQAEIIAVGTNSAATTAMVKAGASKGATGENAVRVCLKNASCVIGPMGIVLADSMLGEITQAVASMIASSPVPKILIPVNHKNLEIVGVQTQQPLAEMIKEAVQKVKNYLP
ncbi:MAG: DUF3842 family protein [Bacillota bacterium]|jgi:hypothetical protein|nr:hypothetical protein [Peptococcaceae bacterium]